ncbi:hypothetical protein [Streptomyces sp. cmx-18-6]|uniref:hypothetical protein n=1 Tax=Streptomyces sp. cmx-18-6 TaxID=2790930 RepID=UPI003980196A
MPDEASDAVRGRGAVRHRLQVRVRRATAQDAEAVTRVFLASRAAAMPYLPRVHSDEDTLAWITHVVLPTSTAEIAGRPLSLYVFRRNAAARAFYERHGFTAVAFDDGGRNEEGEPDVLYRWTP